MNDFMLFGISVTLGLLAWGAVCYSYIWPRVKVYPISEAARPLLYLNLFRFAGASFLIPGVAGPGLQREFAAPGAYGDLIAVALAWTALALRRRSAGIAALWVFNIWGTGDLVYAFYKGLFDPHFHPADLGATFYIPTVYVPLLLCAHFMIFVMLLRPASKSISARQLP
jgi:hypothetical protein